MLNHSKVLFLLCLTICFSVEVSGSEKSTNNSKPHFSFSDSAHQVKGFVNSPYRENGPLVTLDGQTMFFSRSLHPDNVGGVNDQEDIWYSQWNATSEIWEAAVRFPFFNNEYPNFINSVAIDHGVPTLILGNDYSNPKKMKAGLSYSRLVDGQWTEPMKYEIENFTNHSERVDYFVSEDASILLFSGMMDYHGPDRNIYLSEKIDESTWSAPVELKAVNTTGDDSAPYMIDNKYLFFSTDSLGGYGGKDIFVMKRLSTIAWDKWSEPINLGPQVNDANDNVYFHYSKMRNKAYLTKGVHDDDMDIVEIDIFLEEEIFGQLEGENGCTARSFYQNTHESTSGTFASQKCFDFQVLELKEEDISGREFIWHFGDEQIGYGISTEHCYTHSGKYMVNFSVVENTTYYQFNDEYNFEVDVLDDITLELTSPFSADSTTNHKAYSAKLLNLPNDIANVAYFWSFGDGNYDCGSMVEHDYIFGDAFEVRVTAVFEMDGQTIQLTQSVQTKVNPAI